MPHEEDAKAGASMATVSRDQDLLHAEEAPPDWEYDTFPSVQGIQGRPTQKQSGDDVTSPASPQHFPSCCL